MNRHAELADIEAQTAAHNAALRAEHAAAAPEPTAGIYYIGNEPYDVPTARDLAEMETWR